MYCIFGGSSRILTDNGTEFKSKEMKQICEDLDIKQVFSPVYTPQANGRLEGWHRFLKACIAKHIRGTDVEWDDLIPLAVSAYNFFPCQSSKESRFVLMFGRDPITPIAKMLEPKLKFYDEKGIGVNMDTLRKLYTVVAENIRKAREKQPRQETAPTKLQVNDLVLVKDPESAAFDPKYMPNYRITAMYGRNRIEVQDERGNKSVRRAAHVKICEPVDKVINQLPPQAVYEQYGRRSKLLIHPKDVPEVPLQLFGQHQKEPGNIDESDESQSRKETDVMVHEISHKDGCGMKPMNSQPGSSDTINASWNRQGQQQVEHHGAGLVTNDLQQMDIDSIDESRSRLNIVTRYKSTPEIKLGMTRDCVCTQDDIDTSDESRSRLQSSPLGTARKSGQERFKVTDEGTEVTEQEGVEQTWNPGQTVCNPDEKSRSRQPRCSMSADQQMQQPVTPVVQSESVGPTVVNIQDVDECLVTNKHTNVKHDSIPASNQWLSSAFSKITFGVGGKSNAGEEVTENVHACNKSTLTSVPEFNFSL